MSIMNDIFIAECCIGEYLLPS